MAKQPKKTKPASLPGGAESELSQEPLTNLPVDDTEIFPESKPVKTKRASTSKKKDAAEQEKFRQAAEKSNVFLSNQ